MAMTWKAAKKAAKWETARKMLDRWDRDDVLKRIGLEEREPAKDWAGALGLFALGMLVGAGMGILFAPRSGTEVRSMVSDKIRRRGEDFQSISGGAQSQTPSGF
jgi:hypothetical protein